jgi:hypothetical protein
MNQQPLLQIMDYDLLKQQILTLAGDLKGLDEQIKSIKPLTDIYKNAAGSAEARKAQDDLLANNQKLSKSQTELTLSLQEYQRIQSQLATQTAKINALESESAKQLAQKREEQRQLNQEIKKTAEVNASAEGSIKQLRAQLSLLTAEYDKMGAAQRGSAQGQALKDQIFGQTEALKKLEAETGRYQRNVGNYTGALSILQKQLQEVRTAIDENTRSGNQNSEAQDRLQREASLLEQILGQQERGFRSVSMEVRATERALATMAAQGLQNTEAFQQLRESVAESHREMNEFQQQQKLFSAEVPQLQAMTLAAKGLGGIYATGAGAAALFADGNEKVEKELNKLVAIMTILQGLNEVHELLEKRGAIATIFRTTVEKLKNFVMTGNTRGLRENTEAMAENTIATEASGAAAKVATGSMIALRTALIATGIGALLVLLPSVASAMQGMGEKSKKAKEGVKELADEDEHLADVMKNTENAYVEAVKGLDDVRNALDLAKAGVISKQQAVDVYNESLGKTMGQVKSLDEVEQQLSDKSRVQAYVDMMMYKAAANYALEEAAKKTFEAEQQRLNFKTPEKVLSFWDKLNMPFDNAPSKQGEVQKAAAPIINKAIDTANEVADSYKNIADDFQKKVADLAKQFHLNPFGIDGKGDGKKGYDPKAEEAKNNEALLKLRSEFRKLDIEDQEKYLQQIMDDERNSYDLRLNALHMYAGLQKSMADVDSNTEIKSIDIKLQRIKEIESKAASKRSDDEKKLLDSKKVVLTEKELAEAKHASKIEDINRDLAVKLQKIADDQKKKVFDQQVEDVHHFKSVDDLNSLTEESNALDALNQKYEEGKISVEEYNKQKEEIKNKGTVATLENERKEVLKLIAIYRQAGKDTTDLEIKALGLHDKIEEAKTKKTKEETDKRTKEEKAKQKEVADAAAAFTKELLDGTYQSQLNAIQKQIDANTRWKDAEIERINNSTLSEQDKAAKLAQINAKAQADQDKMDKQKRDVQLRQARFDREMTLLKIVEETAIAVATDNSNPLTAWKIPYDIALGAIQAATVMAKPLPAYAKGTKSAPGGWSLTDEKGAELYIEPGGKMYMGNNQPTLRNVTPGTEIVPHDQVNQRLHQFMMQRAIEVGSMQKTDETAKELRSMKELLKWQTMEYKKAMKQQKTPKVIVNNNGAFSEWKRKNIYE